jgi:hypothetical protein
MMPTSKTEIAQEAVTMTIALATTKFLRNQVDEQTNFDSDSIAVKVGTYTVGALVAVTLKPKTDKVVVFTREFVKSWRDNKDTDK